MTESFRIEKFANGLTLLAQPMDDVASSALSLAVRCGASLDAEGREGSAAVAAEWILRGAGARDSRQLNDAMDALGCQHSESVQSEHLYVSAAQLGRNLPDVLDILADILQAPRLDDETFDPCRALVEQDLHSLEDEPARKCNHLLREAFFPYPLGRLTYGTSASLAAMTPAEVRRHVRSHFSPADAILAVAGRFDWDSLRDHVARRFGDWSGQAIPDPTTKNRSGGVKHISKNSAQTHLALACKAPACSELDDYYPARVAETVLARGMGSRLFTEVREKRGLVYHISANYVSLRDHAGLFIYAGSRPDLASETLRITVRELRRLVKGVQPDELDRAKTQLRSALVMQGDSTLSRANTLVNDWIHLGRLRTLSEVSEKVRGVTDQDIRACLERYPAENFTILTIGPEPLADVDLDRKEPESP